MYIKSTIGAIFCQVNISSLLIQFNPSKISGNQKWKGAAPIFVNKPILMTIIIILLIFKDSFSIIIIIENMIRAEAKAWVKKYLIDASEENKDLDFNKGIIEIRLISNPIHIPNHEYEEIAVKVPKIIKFKNKIL